ncbi:MAG: acyl-CoA thioesterase [Gammaproteobacteria bacterium]
MNIFKCTVYFEDTDAIQVVYHANYLKFCDRARTQWMEDLGISFSQLLEEEASFVVADANMRFIAPARLGERLEVHSSVSHFGRASITFSQLVKQADSQKTLCDVTIKCAYVSGAELKPTRMPRHYPSLFSH